MRPVDRGSGCSSQRVTDPGPLLSPEAFLIPAPYYGAITQHVYLYGNVRLVCVYLDSEVTDLDTRPFKLTVEKLEMALQGANSEVWGSNPIQGWEWVGLSRVRIPLPVADLLPGGVGTP